MSVAIVGFVLISIAIGVFASRRIHGDVGNYYVAGRTLPFWVVACTLSAQSVDSNATLGSATASFGSGFWAGAIIPCGLALALALTGLFVAKPLHRMRLLTLPDYYHRRYGAGVESLVTVLTVISFVILLAGNLAGAGILLSYFLGVPYAPAVAAFALAVLLYTIAGGLFSVAWNDVFHILTLVIFFPLAFLAVLIIHGTGLLTAAIETGFSMAPVVNVREGALLTWAGLLALGLGDIVALDFMERVFAARSPETAQRACFIAAFVTLLVGIPVTLIGMMAGHFYPPTEEFAFLRMVGEQIPRGIGVLVCMGILGASMSTADGAILATSTAVTKNLLHRRLPRLVSDANLLLCARISATPIMLAAVVIAIRRPDPGNLLILAFDVVFAGCLMPLLLGIYWPRATAVAAAVSIVCASLCRVVLGFVMPPELAGLETLLPPLVSLVLMLVISRMTGPQVSAEAREV